MINLNYLMDQIMYQLFKIREKINNPLINIYVNKVENRVTFKVKTGYSLELLPPETMDCLEVLKIK